VPNAIEAMRTTFLTFSKTVTTWGLDVIVFICFSLFNGLRVKPGLSQFFRLLQPFILAVSIGWITETL